METASQSTEQDRPRPQERSIGVTILLITLGALLAGLMAWMVIAAVSENRSTGWGASGTVGDTFGGTVGPILSFAALMATIVLALVVQPGRERRAREEREAERDAARKLKEKDVDDARRREIEDTAVRRAEGVVAWVAETYSRVDAAGRASGAPHAADESRMVGVVVSNSSGSVVRKLDLVLHFLPRSEHATAGDIVELINRETLLPPGTWFLPVDAKANDDSGSANHVWKLPIPVETSGVPTVDLVDSAAGSSDQRDVVQPYSLRPRLRTSGTEHYELNEIRYRLYGELWKRDAEGRVKRAEAWPPDREAEFESTAVAAREEATGPQGQQAMKEIIRQTMEHICAIPSAHEEPYARFAGASAYLSGVHAVSRNRATGIYLHLSADETGPIIRVAGNRAAVYPDVIEYYGEFDSKRRTPGPKGDPVAAVTAKLMAHKRRTCGDNPQAERWFDTAGKTTKAWQDFLTELVAKAAAAERAG